MESSARTILLTLIVFAGASLYCSRKDAVQMPNILFILADDMGYGDLRSYNPDSKIPTPNMDRLASEGMRFTDAHSASGVCTPTRYGILTGRYSWRSRLKSGVLQGYSPALIEPGRATVASFLKRSGYRTACIGKWHLGLGKEERTDYSKPLHPGPGDYGFDYFFGIPASLDMPPYLFVENDRPVEPATASVAASRMRREGGEGFWREGEIAPGFRHEDVLPLLTRKAVEFLESHARDTPRSPFFLYLPLTAPHTPWMPTAEFRGKSGAGYYGDFTVQVDWTVGQVLAALGRLGMAQDTLVILTSDNGSHWKPEDIAQYGHRANGSLRGMKADIWEGGHRIPFIARWPGRIEAASTSHETVCLNDLFATSAALVGADLPEGAAEDSFNLLPVLTGKQGSRPVREAVVHHSSRGMFAIRRGHWKLILGLGSGGFTEPREVSPEPGGPQGQLYNLKDDPGETRDLYMKRPEVVEQLSKLLGRYQKEGRSRPPGD